MLRDLSHQKEITVIMISHDLNIAAKYSDSMIMMHEGSIFAVGSPEDVVTEENIRSVYDVDSLIIQDCGRPHIVVRDREFDSEPHEHSGHGAVLAVSSVDEEFRTEAPLTSTQ